MVERLQPIRASGGLLSAAVAALTAIQPGGDFRCTKFTEIVAIFLCQLAVRARERGQTPAQAIRFSLPLIREDVGHYLGLTIETKSRQLSQLKGEGLIRLVSRREIEIPNLAALWSKPETRTAT